MPTGYTEGILNGKIKTFEEFAILCIRAFGAAIHMRDESLDVQYKPREVEKYYYDSLETAKKNLEEFLKKSDDEILDDEIKSIESSINYYENKISETKNNLKKLKGILKSTKNWNPPTPDHEEFKKFMITQLEETIKWDGDYEYCEENLNTYLDLKSNLDIEKIKKNKLETLEQSIEYSKTRLKEEIERVNDSNQWVESLLQSLLDNKKNRKFLK